MEKSDIEEDRNINKSFIIKSQEVIKRQIFSEIFSDEDNLNYGKVDPETFDTDVNIGWRRFSENKLFIEKYLSSKGRYIDGNLDAIRCIRNYLETHIFDDSFEDKMNRWGILFHLAQQYAIVGDYYNALNILYQLKSENSKKHSQIYIDATIAFLERRYNGLLKLKINHKNIHPLDKKFINYFIKYFKLSYIEAYLGGYKILSK